MVLADRWNVTDAEVERRYPCDDHVADPTLRAWRGVDVATEPHVLWPWIAQIRVAPYSHDWIDNRGRRSPQHLPDLPDPQVGDPFTASGGRDLGRITSVEPGRHLTATIMGAHMSYVLVPAGDATRLLLKVVGRPHRLIAPLFCLGDLVMARRQLLNLAELAERS